MSTPIKLTELEKLIIKVVTLPHKTQNAQACEIIDQWYLHEKGQTAERFPDTEGGLLFSSRQVHLKDKAGHKGANLYTFWGKQHASGCINAQQAKANILFALGHLHHAGHHCPTEDTDPKNNNGYKHGFDKLKFDLVRLAGSLDCYTKPCSPTPNATWQDKVKYQLDLLEHEAWKVLKDDRKDAIAAMTYVTQLKHAWRAYQQVPSTSENHTVLKASFARTIRSNQVLLAKHRRLSLTTVNILSALAVPYGLVCLGAAVWNWVKHDSFSVPWRNTDLERTTRSLEHTLSSAPTVVG